MRRLNLLTVFSLLFALLLFGVISPPTECRAGSPEETKIKQVVDEWLTAWNNQDKKSVLALFSEDAGIAKGKQKKLLTKKQYSKEISKRLAKNRNIKAGEPSIHLEDNNAEVIVPMKFPSLGCGADVVFLIRPYDNEWMIYRFSTTNLKKF